MIKSTVLLGALGLALVCGASTASAMPIDKSLAVQAGVQPETVRWVCNRWGRCWHVHRGYYSYGYYPRHRYWRHRHRHHWHRY